MGKSISEHLSDKDSAQNRGQVKLQQMHLKLLQKEKFKKQLN